MAQKNDRTFFPELPISTILADYRDQLHDIGETLVLRVYNGPSHIWYEADDFKHVFVDSAQAIDQSITMLRKLLVKDAFKLDTLEILDKPCSGNMKGPVLLMESYTWTAMCILGYMLGTFLGDFEPLTSSIQPILPPICAFILAVAVPFYTHARLRKAHWPEDEQRSEAFHAAILFGVLASYAFGKPSVEFASCLPLLVLGIGTLAGYRDFYRPCRVAFLNVTVTAPYVAYVASSFFFFERSLVYILAWTMLCAVVVVDLQLKLGRLKRRWASKELEYWSSTAVIIAAHFILNHFVSMFGVSSEARNENAPNRK